MTHYIVAYENSDGERFQSALFTSGQAGSWAKYVRSCGGKVLYRIRIRGRNRL